MDFNELKEEPFKVIRVRKIKSLDADEDSNNKNDHSFISEEERKYLQLVEYNKKKRKERELLKDAKAREMAKLHKEFGKVPYSDRYCLYIWIDKILLFDIINQYIVFNWYNIKETTNLELAKEKIIKDYATYRTPVIIYKFQNKYNENQFLTQHGKEQASISRIRKNEPRDYEQENGN